MAAEMFSAPYNEAYYSQHPHDFFVPESAAHKQSRALMEYASQHFIDPNAVEPYHDFWVDEADPALNTSFDPAEVSIGGVYGDQHERMALAYNQVVHAEGLAVNGLEARGVEKAAILKLAQSRTISLGTTAIWDSVELPDARRAHLQLVHSDREEAAA